MNVVEEQVRQLADTGAMVTTSSGQPAPFAYGPVAAVYSAPDAGKPMALKVFPTKFGRRTLAAVEREQEKLRALASSAPILPVDGVDQLDDGRHALRMERCAQSLTTLVQRVGALPPEDVVVLGYALALALAAAHGAGIPHGGVSPDNVLFRESGEPVLADFGVSLREAFPRDPLHAIECVSPEALRSGMVDEGTDLYGLGAVLHFALAGSSPHPGRLGEQPGERVLRVLGSPVPAINRPGVPVELSTVVARLLAPDAAHRPRDAAWVAEQLAGMLPQGPNTPPLAEVSDDLGPSPTAPEIPAEGDADGFDDFASTASPTSNPGSANVDGPARSLRRYFLAGGAVLAGVLVFALMLLPENDSDELGTIPRMPPPPVSAAPQESGAAAAVQLELADPIDLGDQVVLNWTSDRTLDFAVIVAGEGEPNHTLLAQRNHTMTIPTDPVRKYCFLVQASDSNQVYATKPKAIRDAVCHL